MPNIVIPIQTVKALNIIIQKDIVGLKEKFVPLEEITEVWELDIYIAKNLIVCESE